MRKEFEHYKVADGVWGIGTSMGTIPVYVYLIDVGDGFVLFDTGLKKTAKAVLQLLKEIDCQPNVIKTIIISHSHHDHIGALAELAEVSGAKVLAHALAKNWMIDHERQFREFFGRFKPYITLTDEFHAFFFDNLWRPWLADMWLNDFPLSLSFHREIKLVSTPGHSEDCLSVWLPDDKILICGDALMGTGVGGSLPQYSDFDAYRATLNSFLQLQPAKLLSGHFQPVELQDIEPVIQQSLRLSERIDKFIRESLQKANNGYTLKFLVEMVCARFGRPVVPQAYITVLAHLHAFEKERAAFEEDGKWYWGEAKNLSLPVL